MSELAFEYEQRYRLALQPLSERLRGFINDCLSDYPRIDRIVTRPKSVKSFLAKAAKMRDGLLVYEDPLNQIQDQIGARVVAYYLDDVDPVSQIIEKYFKPIEFREVFPDSDSEFTYFGKHFILLLPDDVLDSREPKTTTFFELQVKTLFQHAWSEANHDLGYKPSQELSSDFKRKIAFASAQAWGADQMFSMLRKELIENTSHCLS